MTDHGAPWAPPESSPVDPRTGASSAYSGGIPLGGVVPVPEVHREPSQVRELVLTALLLLGAVLAGAASLLSWRDEGTAFAAGVEETGWVLPDGSMGRGWIAVLLGVVLAAAGVFVAADRMRPGRALACLGGVGLIVFSILEWGLGAGRARTGPGIGVWLMLGVGVAVLIAVGTLGSPPPSTSQRDGSPA